MSNYREIFGDPIIHYRRWVDPTGFSYWLPVTSEQNPEANHCRTEDVRYGLPIWDEDNENVINVLGVTGV